MEIRLMRITQHRSAEAAKAYDDARLPEAIRGYFGEALGGPAMTETAFVRMTNGHSRAGWDKTSIREDASC